MSDLPEMTEAERDAFVAEYVRKINAFAEGSERVCPECGEPVTGAICYEKSELDVFSLYVNPCNHRLGLWSKVPEWIAEVEFVPLDTRDGEFNEEDWDEDDSPDPLQRGNGAPI